MDLAFALPDAIHALPEAQRAARATIHSDLCSLDDRRFFIRGVVYAPVQQLGTLFGWGVWAEVSREVFLRYQAIYDQDASGEPPAAGVLANCPPGYERIVQPLEIAFGPADQRPTFRLAPTDSDFYREHVGGMPAQKWHSIIERHLGSTDGDTKPS
ncbi:MAG: DUF2199 domain-containing protein [Chromatiaceae bacterium]|nr:DUF2199 domain-containing protein [Chromatiaceae bacterium]